MTFATVCLSLFACFSSCCLSLLLNFDFILFHSIFSHKTPGLMKCADRCKHPAAGTFYQLCRTCSWYPWLMLWEIQKKLPGPAAALCWLHRAEKCSQLGTSTPSIPAPGEDALIAAVSLCSCTCLPRFPPSPRRGCLISRLAAFNPSSSVPGWELKTCNKQIEVYDIIIANISALFSSQGGEFWNERRSEACQCVKFYGLMSQNCSTSQLGATPVLWMLLKTKANST